MKPETLSISIKHGENTVFAQTVEGTGLLPKIMSSILTAPSGTSHIVNVVVNNEPISFTKGGADIRGIAAILNDLRLPITRTVKSKEAAK